MATMGKTMTTFWIDSRIPEDSRWHSVHQGEFRTSDRLADHFVGKLREECRKESSEMAIMVRFTFILKELLESYESQTNLLLKLADTGRVVRLLHQYIDNALDTLDILDQTIREDWHNHLLRERKERLELFESFVNNEHQLTSALGNQNQHLEIVTLLRYCVDKYHDGLTPLAHEKEKYRDKLTEKELDTISMVYDVVVHKTGIVSGVLPEWFVTSEHEWSWVNKGKLEDSKETWDSMAREKDANDKVSIQVREEICEEVCVRLASVWTELNHPHLRKFYGASYVGKPFVIHETCFPPTFEKDLWHYVADCALGLQYIHDRGLVYYDISPSTFLSSYSEHRGVIDGLGLVPRSEADRHLQKNENSNIGLESSVTRDILRFGISLFFLLAKARNSNLPSNERDKIFDSWNHNFTKHLPPDRPHFIYEAEWEILQGMCALNPTSRTDLVDVAFKMRLLAPEKIETQDEADQFDKIVSDVGNYFVLSFGNTVEVLLSETKTQCEISDMNDADSDQSSKNCRVYYRLNHVYEQLQGSANVTCVLVDEFCGLLLRFYRTLEAEADPFDCSRTISRTVANMNSRFHHKIDNLIRRFSILGNCDNGKAYHQWHPNWEQDHHGQYALLLSCLKNPEEFLDKIEDYQLPAAVATMRFEAHSRPGAYSPEVLKKIITVLKEAVNRAKDVEKLRDTQVGEPLPKWFIMGYQIELGDFISDGSFGSVHFGKWFGTNVVVKLLKAENITPKDRADFRREADLWFTLNHSNLIKLYGACYEGQQPFFVCERATRQILKTYLNPKNGRRHEAWFRLLQAALGLQHLHDHNIEHGDLKGNNILVCDGGATKIADFGLSVLGSTPSHDIITTARSLREP